MKRWLGLLVFALAAPFAHSQQYGLYQTCQLQTAQGQAVGGAQVYFLTQPANTSTLTPQAQVYSSSTGGTVNQPIFTNGQGTCSAYLSPGTYTVCYVSPYTGTQCTPDQSVPSPPPGTYAVTSVTILTGGDYSVCPTSATFAGGEGEGAAGTPVCTGTAVTGVTMTSGGSYISVPSVSFTGGTGAGASGIANLTAYPGVVPIVAGGTGATNAATGLSNLGGLPLTGGTMTGPIGFSATNGQQTLSNMALPYTSGMAVPPANAATASAQTSVIQTSGYSVQNSFGDSITACVGPTNPADCYTNAINVYAGSPTLNNYGVGGDQMCDTSIDMFKDISPGASSTQLNTFWDGTNDAAFSGLTGYANGPMTQCQNSMLTWGSIPSTLKTLPAALTPATNWIVTTMDGVNVIESTTNGAAQAIPYTITTTGQSVVIWFVMKDGNGGCFTVTDSYDSTRPLQACNNTGMPIATHNGGTYGMGTLYFLDNITGRVAGNYTLTITVSSPTSASNIVAIAGIGVVPPIGSGNPVWEAGVPRQWTGNPQGSIDQITKFYNQTVANNVSFNQGLGLPVNFVDVRNNWFGTSPEMYLSGNPVVHPSNLGGQEIASAWESPTAAQTYVPNSSVLGCSGVPRQVTSASALIDWLSLSDTYVYYTDEGTTVELPPNPGPPYVAPGTRLSGGPVVMNMICLTNSSSSTGPITFAVPATNIYEIGSLAGLSIAPGQSAIIYNSQVNYGVTAWNALVTPAGGYVTTNQSTQQLIQNGSTANNTGYEILGVGIYGGQYFLSSPSAGTFNTGALYMDNTGNLGMKLCTQQTGVVGQPSVPSCTGAMEYDVAWLNEGQTFTAGMGFSAGVNHSGTTSPIKLNSAAGTTGQCLISQGTGNTDAWSTCLPLTGTTGSIGGSALLVNNCSTGTATVTGVSSAMTIQVTPVADPNGSTTQDYDWYGYVSGTSTVTVKVCALVAGTPTATTYNVRATQ